MDQVLIVLFQKPFRIPVQPAEWNTHLLILGPPQQYDNNNNNNMIHKYRNNILLNIMILINEEVG